MSKGIFPGLREKNKSWSLTFLSSKNKWRKDDFGVGERIGKVGRAGVAGIGREKRNLGEAARKIRRADRGAQIQEARARDPRAYPKGKIRIRPNGARLRSPTPEASKRRPGSHFRPAKRFFAANPKSRGDWRAWAFSSRPMDYYY